MNRLPSFGAGVGLRHQHFDEILEIKPKVNWFEIIVEDFIDCGGWAADRFEQIASNYQIIPHGVSMSIGSTDPLDMNYLKKLRLFLDKHNSPWHSDHLCFTAVDHTNLEDLMPLPFTEECVAHLVERIKMVQDIIARPFLLENITRYITISDREMSEAEFISRILEGADCGLLLDITNVHLNSKFHNFCAKEFITNLPLHRVRQIHLSGYQEDSEPLIDSHDAPVPKPVWELLKETVALTGPTSVLIEWDAGLPPLQQLLHEAEQAENYLAK